VNITKIRETRKKLKGLKETNNEI